MRLQLQIQIDAVTATAKHTSEWSHEKAGYLLGLDFDRILQIIIEL